MSLVKPIKFSKPLGSRVLNAHRWRVAARPAALQELRRKIQNATANWTLTEDCLQTLLMIVNELVTNVVEHVGSACTVTIRQHAANIRVMVTDSSTDVPALHDQEPSHARGKGLWILDRLSSRWGWPAHDDAGKTVWATLDPSPTGSC